MEQEKQKAEVKHILLQKQRALADLFKMLAQIGQSESFNVVLENVFINQGSFYFICSKIYSFFYHLDVYADSRLIVFCFCPGLSYRKGLTWGHTADPDETLCLQPLEMKIALSAVKTQDNKEHTYVTSIYRLMPVIELRVGT